MFNLTPLTIFFTDTITFFCVSEPLIVHGHRSQCSLSLEKKLLKIYLVQKYPELTAYNNILIKISRKLPLIAHRSQNSFVRRVHAGDGGHEGGVDVSIRSRCEGRGGDGGGGVTTGGFHAEAPDRPATSDAVVP